MRGVRKTLFAALAALLIAIGLAACGGGGDDSSSTATTSATQAEGGASAGGSSQGADKEGKGGEDGAGQSAGKSGGSDDSGGNGGGSDSNGSSGGGSGSSGGSAKKASEFVPKAHSDSGGGSTQYKTKGGDNSVQEYGSEGEGSDFEGPATALHNFLDARAQENWAAACEYTAKAMQESLQKLAAQAKPGIDTSCSGILGALVNPEAIQSMKAEAEEADVRSVRIDGERGFVLYTASEGTLYSMPMIDEGGSWKVSALGGSPIG